jgi:hypothetical protein
MRQRIVHSRANGNNTKWINGGVRPVVVSLDVRHVDTGADARHLVDLSYVVLNVGVVRNALLVALEMHYVHFIKTNLRVFISEQIQKVKQVSDVLSICCHDSWVNSTPK